MNQKNKIILQIITPYGTVFSDYIHNLSCCGIFGSFEILPFHENYATLLKISVLFTNNNKKLIPIGFIGNSCLRFLSNSNCCYLTTEKFICFSQLKTYNKNKILNCINISHNREDKAFYSFILNHI